VKVCGLDNAAIARVLREIADLLEIKGENPFKIRAYRNGADIAANHPHELSRLDETGLREIPGFGKDLAARIREVLGVRGMSVGETIPFRDKETMKRVLDAVHGNRTEAARILGISKPTLYAKLPAPKEGDESRV